MDTNEHESGLLLKEEVHAIVGCAFDVLNSLGHGFHEKPYENALVVDFQLLRIPYSQQRRYPICYKNVQVAEYIPDLVAFDAVIVDTKVIPRIRDMERGQMLNYLKCSGLRVGHILNFFKPKLEWQRIVL